MHSSISALGAEVVVERGERAVAGISCVAPVAHRRAPANLDVRAA